MGRAIVPWDTVCGWTPLARLGQASPMSLRQTIGSTTWVFDDLKDLMAKATPLRSGDVLAGVAASCAEEAVAARMLLADLPISAFLAQPLIPYETDEVTRLICDAHDSAAFAPI